MIAYNIYIYDLKKEWERTRTSYALQNIKRSPSSLIYIMYITAFELFDYIEKVL